MREFQIELTLPVPGEPGAEDDVTCTVTFNPGWFQRGNRSGHPDNWTPDDGENAEILTVVREDTGEEILAALSAYNVRLVEDRARAIEESPYEENW